MKIKVRDYGDFDTYGNLVGKEFGVLDTITRYKVRDEDGNIHWINSRHCDELKYICKGCGEFLKPLHTPINGAEYVCTGCGHLMFPGEYVEHDYDEEQ